ncbi:MAG TPA: hypothetical protein VGF02_13215 [Pseudolabrys sp.]
MRVVLAIALMVFGFAGVTAARAADFPVQHSDTYSAGYLAYAERAGMLLVYDNQPGVFVRAYWRAPWRDHHYFPATGARPKIGRDENLNARVALPRPAKTLRRSWSNEAALDHALEREQPIILMPPAATPAPPPQNQKP